MINEKSNNQAMIKSLAAAGLHFGYSKSRSHPSTRDYIFGFKNHHAVIDLNRTMADLHKAAAFIQALASGGKEVLWVGNKDEAKDLVRRAAESLGAPYVTSRWLGGTFTNWPQIKSRIERLKDLREKREKGELSVYTKKERLLIDREIARLERYLDSLTGMSKLPAAVIMVDPGHESIVVKEALIAKIPVVALAGSDCDLAGVTYPVVGNDANIQSIKFFITHLSAAYRAGRENPAVAAPEPSKTNG